MTARRVVDVDGAPEWKKNLENNVCGSYIYMNQARLDFSAI